MRPPLALLLSIFLLPPFALSQSWQAQSTHLPLSTSSITAFLGYPSVVDSTTCWVQSILWSSTNNYNWFPYPGYSRTTDGGRTWVCDSIPGAEQGMITQIHARSRNVAFASVTNLAGYPGSAAGIYKTTDGGATWARKISNPVSGFGFLYVYFFNDTDGVAVGDSVPINRLRISTTSDGGEHWSGVPGANIPDIQLPAWRYFLMFASSENSVWFWHIEEANRLYRSTDKGHTWSVPYAPNSTVGGPSFAFQDSLTGIMVQCDYGSPVANAATMKTTDGGFSWSLLPNPSGFLPGSISYIPGTKAGYMVTGDVLTGQPTGSAYTLDGGDHWTVVDGGLHSFVTFAAPAAGWCTVYGSNIIYRYTGNPITTSISARGGFLRTFRLEQNYPNPFNPTTKIHYEIPTTSHVSLAIYDMLGRKLSVLVDEREDAGGHDASFDGSRLASGVYVCRLAAGSSVSSRKMILVR